METEAIVVIPGLDSKEVGFALERVVNKIKNNLLLEEAKVKESEIPNRLDIEAKIKKNDLKKIYEIYEIFWGDIISENYNADMPTYKKFIFGLELITFWFISPIWREALKNKFLFIGVCFSGILLTLWYLSILFLIFSSQATAELIEPLLSFLNYDHKTTVDSHWILHSSLWAGVAVVLSILPTAIILKMSGFTMKYLKSNMVRTKVRNRISNQINTLKERNDLDRITLFAHSLGALPTSDYLADLENNSGIKIRCVTIGAPVSFLAQKSSFLQERLKKCQENESIHEWLDFFSKEDYLCSYVKIDSSNSNFKSYELDMDSSWLSRLGTDIHLQYFKDSRVIDRLL